MKTRKTIYHLIVDKSGSMMDCVDSTINGFNEQVNRIKDKALEFTEEDITMGLTTFNDNVNHLYYRQNPKEMVLLNYENYRPSGGTALLDAVGETISEIERQISTNLIATTVIVVILTDGYENSSKYYTYHQIAAMIRHLEETKKWSFSYIGADIDAFHTSQMLSIKQENVIAIDKQDMNQMMMDLGESMRHYSASKDLGNVKTSIFDIFDKKDRRSK